MGKFENFLKRNCKQTAVYWGNPQNTGRGGTSYDTPIEIKCRWEDKMQVVGLLGEDNIGERLLSRAIVFLLQDLDVNGLLYLGTLDDLDSTMEASPNTVDNICIVKRFEKTPALGSNTDFVRKAFLTPWLT